MIRSTLFVAVLLIANVAIGQTTQPAKKPTTQPVQTIEEIYYSIPKDIIEKVIQGTTITKKQGIDELNKFLETKTTFEICISNAKENDVVITKTKFQTITKKCLQITIQSRYKLDALPYMLYITHDDLSIADNTNTVKTLLIGDKIIVSGKITAIVKNSNLTLLVPSNLVFIKKVDKPKEIKPETPKPTTAPARKVRTSASGPKRDPKTPGNPPVSR